VRGQEAACPVDPFGINDEGGDRMSDDEARDNTTEEPQEERGPVGSRDKGEPGPGGGPADRPAEDSEAEDETGVNPQSPVTDSPHLRGS
jgi:hypothetical protein